VNIKEFKIEKIDHLAADDAVGQIAEGAAKDDGHRKPRPSLLLFQLEEIEHDDDAGDHREDSEEEVVADANSKGHAGIFDIGQTEKIPKYRNRFMETHI